MSWFIDKMVMHQEYPSGGLPRVGKHGIVRHDIATGELVSDSLSSLFHEGSFSSNLQIRCTGSSVTVSGNPSRWNRSDNLWGFTTIEQCAQVYNQILAGYGLPPFTRCTRLWHRQTSEDEVAKQVADGAIIRHLDWTRNHMVGRGNEYSFLRGASSLTIGRALEPYLYPNGATLEWLNRKLKVRGEGSTYRYDKIYIKALDLKDKRIKRLKNASQDEIKYYDQLIEYCEDLGIVREEQSKKTPFLKKHKLNYYGLCNELDFLPYLNDIDIALSRLEVTSMVYETIAEKLIEKGICKSRQSANATESYALKWLHGTPLDRTKSQYFEHKSRLLKIGIDVTIPYDLTKTRLQIKRSDVVNLQIVKPPSWYVMPRITQLRAA